MKNNFFFKFEKQSRKGKYLFTIPTECNNHVNKIFGLIAVFEKFGKIGNESCARLEAHPLCALACMY